MQNRNEPEPVAVPDLVAGSGGPCGGFTPTLARAPEHAFKILLSIEKDPVAHHPLELRSVFRQFRRRDVPDDHYLHMEGKLTRDELLRRHPVAAANAQTEAWNTELGNIGSKEVARRIILRDAARLQTSPDNYLFYGSGTQQYVQVDNAVHPLLAGQIDGEVGETLPHFRPATREEWGGTLIREHTNKAP